MGREKTGPLSINQYGAETKAKKGLWPFRKEIGIPLIYLIAISGAEVVTNITYSFTSFTFIFAGVISHIVILAALIIHSTLVRESSLRKLLMALCLAPLTRILSLSMPLIYLQAIYWYVIIYSILAVATWITGRRLSYTATEVGLNTKNLSIQMVLPLFGFILGIAEYIILRPAPLITELRWEQIWLPAIILLVGTGFVEEYIFRGVGQKAALDVLGKWGLPYMALIFAVLHLIHNSMTDIVFVFAVAMLFGWIVKKTGSLLGVTLAHGFTNITLYLIAPFFAGYIPLLPLP